MCICMYVIMYVHMCVYIYTQYMEAEANSILKHGGGNNGPTVEAPACSSRGMSVPKRFRFRVM